MAKKALLDPKNKYPVSQALDLINQMKSNLPAGRQEFDETVELHVNTTRTGQFGNLMLPHGTGKQTKVAIADVKKVAGLA